MQLLRRTHRKSQLRGVRDSASAGDELIPGNTNRISAAGPIKESTTLFISILLQD
jgi:hypothetical protein